MQNRLNKLFWFTKPSRLSLSKDKETIIHQTLSQGSLEDIRFLFHQYSAPIIKKVFLKGKKGLYDPRVIALLKLMLKVKRLNKNKYLKHVS